MPGRSGVTVVTTLGCLFRSAPRLRRIVRPAFPAPSILLGETFLQNLGHIVPRERGLLVRKLEQRHCEEPTGRANARPMTGSATKQSVLRHSGMRHWAQARNPYSRSWLWIPGSLASLAPRNDDFKVIILQLHARPRRGLADIFLGLLERAFQRLGFRHVADFSEMRSDRIGRPVGFGQVDAFGFH